MAPIAISETASSSVLHGGGTKPFAKHFVMDGPQASQTGQILHQRNFQACEPRYRRGVSTFLVVGGSPSNPSSLRALARTFADTGGNTPVARSASEHAFVFTIGPEASASSAGGHRFAPTTGSGGSAESVGAGVSVSTTKGAQPALNTTVHSVASMANSVRGARYATRDRYPEGGNARARLPSPKQPRCLRPHSLQ